VRQTERQQHILAYGQRRHQVERLEHEPGPGPPELGQPLLRQTAQCRTLTGYGAVLARRGQRDKARQLLTDALHSAQACGAGWHTDQALTELRRAGGRTRRIPPGQLSPQEKAVARLARAGRTNRQISRELYLSVNPVETHLAHAYRKLGIGRRSELTGQELD
jgi:DNA-binding CsgD family transcriptional regulator